MTQGKCHINKKTVNKFWFKNSHQTVTMLKAHLMIFHSTLYTRHKNDHIDSYVKCPRHFIYHPLVYPKASHHPTIYMTSNPFDPERNSISLFHKNVKLFRFLCHLPFYFIFFADFSQHFFCVQLSLWLMLLYSSTLCSFHFSQKHLYSLYSFILYANETNVVEWEFLAEKL